MRAQGQRKATKLRLGHNVKKAPDVTFGTERGQPDRHNTSDKRAFVPMHKEMVFDIDMDVYDDVRSCCKGANVCNRCWAYPMVAMKVLTAILDEDFDF